MTRLRSCLSTSSSLLTSVVAVDVTVLVALAERHRILLGLLGAMTIMVMVPARLMVPTGKAASNTSRQ